MRIAVVILVLFSVAFGAQGPIREKDIIPIISQDRQFNFDGTFHSSYKTGNGITVEEQGVLKNAGNKDAETEEVQGIFDYTAPDGTPIHLVYIANENGFQPQGAHLPVAPVDENTPPPIPLAILKSLEYNAAHPEENYGIVGKSTGGKKF
ncbi:endocuticle structural glycoprotein SgAbd-2-like isoform X2 [Diorhabda carinulata]|uniref:endocuticle structural glycoprotein SgAbd-2-like isoform X2 n=1 Tax=Diorhabda carinulata TaxID=1163345 RepID=UPI0025A017FE|nr:endocuticle structural glycoprotein SgAbd-2-like isoform X2 [Diorhabda carinulata]